MSNNVVSIIGGGWSFREVDHIKVPGELIAINDSLVFLQRRPDYVVSMDRMWTEHRWEHIKQASVETYIRRTVLKNVRPDPSWTWFHTFENVNDGSSLSYHIDQLNGANSGACGVNLAFVKKPKELYLFGFDFCLSPEGQSHWYPQYPWAKKVGSGFNAWPLHFELYRLQFGDMTKVFNVSAYSKLRSFQRVTPKELGVAR